VYPTAKPDITFAMSFPVSRLTNIFGKNDANRNDDSQQYVNPQQAQFHTQQGTPFHLTPPILKEHEDLECNIRIGNPFKFNS